MIGGAMRREVGDELEVEITAPTTLEFQIAVAPHPNTEVHEFCPSTWTAEASSRWRSAVCTATAFISSTFQSAT